jgi:5-methylcytosine-specific restriction endonuclease McrA
MSGNQVKIVVDHIKPLHHHWSLRLQKTNLQVLCDECNQGKGAWDETDHRPKPAPDEWTIEDEPSDLIADQLKIRH